MSRISRILGAAVAATALACATAATAQASSAQGSTAQGSTAHAAQPARATATSAPGWRIVATFPLGSSIDHLAAGGQGSAWAVEQCRKPCVSTDGLILRHWNGNAWQAQPQPASAKHTGDAEPDLAIPPGSRVAWAVYGLYDGAMRATAVEWTGKSWASPTVFPQHTAVLGLVAPSSSDVWAFGFKNPVNNPYVVRFNGKAWSEAPAPGQGRGPWIPSASSRGAIWAEGFAAKGFGLAVSRWNGTRWVKQAVPPAPKGADGATGGPLTVSGKDNVWGFGYTGTVAGATGTDTGIDWLVHWNGKAWSTVRVPFALAPTVVIGGLGPDGRGGAWLAAIAANKEYLFHVSQAGHWLRVPAPVLNGAKGTVITGMAAIPGTSSLYAYGYLTYAGNDGTRGVIMKYGA